MMEIENKTKIVIVKKKRFILVITVLIIFLCLILYVFSKIYNPTQLMQK